MYHLIILIICILILVYILYPLKNKQKYYLENYKTCPYGKIDTIDIYKKMYIPKTIYIYWDSTTYPKLIKNTIGSIMRHNSSWRIRVLDISHVNILSLTLPELNNLSKAHQSDYIRLYYLANYGGVYLDASIICFDSIDKWVNIYSNSIQGFKVPFNSYTLETWALGVPKNNIFCRAWLNEFTKSIKIGFDNYCKQLSTDIIPYNDDLRNLLPYLTINACWKVVYNKLKSPHIIYDSFPLKYINENALLTLLTDVNHKIEVPMIKLREADRILFIKHLHKLNKSTDFAQRFNYY